MICRRCEVTALGAQGERTGVCQPCGSRLSDLRLLVGDSPLGYAVEDEGNIEDGLTEVASPAFEADQQDDHRQRAPLTSAWSDDCAEGRCAS